ncbi:unnamed protein product, partial [Meganyctiphanes norvegica]
PLSSYQVILTYLYRMKVVILLVCVAAVAAQFRRRPQSFRSRPQSRPSSGGGGGGSCPGADDTNGGSSYHYSWRHDGNRKYPAGQAVSYCNRLGGGWKAISIEDSSENSFVSRVISGERLDYIWTGGTKSGSGWRWPSGGSFRGLAWSHTGGAQRPQPDNRESGGENCLAILNNFYRDGVKWHDVGCSHQKPIICEC